MANSGTFDEEGDPGVGTTTGAGEGGKTGAAVCLGATGGGGDMSARRDWRYGFSRGGGMAAEDPIDPVLVKSLSTPVVLPTLAAGIAIPFTPVGASWPAVRLGFNSA